MSFLSNVLKSGAHSLVSGLIGAAGAFAATVIVARTLGVEGTAAVAMALWLVFLATAMSDIGITGTLSRYSAEASAENDHQAARRLAAYLSRFLFLAILAGLLLTTIILFLYWGDIQSKYAADRTQGLIFCGLIMTCFVVHMLFAFSFQFLKGLRKFKEITLYSASGTVLQVVGVGGGSLLYGVNGALLGYILFSLPMLLGLRGIRLFGPVERPIAKERMRHYGISLYFAFLFSPLLWVKADLLIVDQLVGEYAVGLFAAAGTIAALLLSVCQMVCHALLPNIVHAASNDPAKFNKASRIAVRLALLLLLPACLIAAAGAPEALTAIFGQAFGGGATTAAILCLAGVGSTLTLIIANVIGAGESNSVLARNGAIGAGLTIVSGTVLTLFMGLIGAALGRLFTQGFIGLLNVRSANKRVQGLLPLGWFVRILSAATLGALTTEAIGWWLGGGLLVLFLSIAVGGTVYLLVIIPLLPLEDDERELVLERLDLLPRAIRRPATWLLSRG
jgi:O-antigen/teichoic acid export membrane protein